MSGSSGLFSEKESYDNSRETNGWGKKRSAALR
jgi:hypothetical protein